jgi:glycerol-3-phosphate dehydrogenase
MKRELARLTDTTFDVAVVGGGIYGAAIAREASLRGLAVALVEKGDFASATSSNSHKIVHGGLRYLQHGDFFRVRESIRERSTLLRIAPHLVRVQSFLMPTYGHGLRGREALLAALSLNELVSFDRNRGLDRSRRIPPARMLSVPECSRLAPGIPREGLTGGALWYDGLMIDSERVALAFLMSAAEKGAAVANYAAATAALVRGGRLEGVRVRDALGGGELDLRARVVIDAGGPWSVRGSVAGGDVASGGDVSLARALNLVLPPIVGEHAIGIGRRFLDAGGRARSDRRLFFLVPWRGVTLAGTSYLPYQGTPDGLAITEAELETFVQEIVLAYPSIRLSPGDVRLVHAGLVPVSGRRELAADVELATRFQIRDHADGMLSVTGVKYTTARGVAEAAVDRVAARLGLAARGSSSGDVPIFGGEFEDGIDRYVEQEVAAAPPGVSAEAIRHWVSAHGSRYRAVMALGAEDRQWLESVAEGSEVTGADIVHSIRQEMAVTLADVVFRRTGLGSAGDPGGRALEAAARIAARELGWSEARTSEELAEVRRRFP